MPRRFFRDSLLHRGHIAVFQVNRQKISNVSRIIKQRRAAWSLSPASSQPPIPSVSGALTRPGRKRHNTPPFCKICYTAVSASTRPVYRVYFVHQVVPCRRLKQFAINFPRAVGNGGGVWRWRDAGRIPSRDSGKSPSAVNRFHFLSLHFRCLSEMQTAALLCARNFSFSLPFSWYPAECLSLYLNNLRNREAPRKGHAKKRILQLESNRKMGLLKPIKVTKLN